MFAFAPIALAASQALVAGVWADDHHHVIAVGKEGRAFASGDGGKTWLPEPAPTHANLLAVWSNGTQTVAVGEGGVVAQLDRTWTVQTLAPKLTMRAVWGDGAHVYAVGGDNHEGVIATSADAGGHWSYVLVHDTVLTAVGGADADHVRAVGTQGAIYGTDNGYSWQAIVSATIVHTGDTTMTSNPLVLDDYNDVRFDHGSWLAVGEIGYAVESKDGHTWQRLESQWAVHGMAFHRGADLVLIGPVERAVLHAGTWKNDDLHPPAALGKIIRTPSGVLYSAAYHGGMTANPRYYSNAGCQGCPAYLDVPWSGAVMMSIDDGVTWTVLTK